MKPIKKIPFSQLKEALLKEQLDILIDKAKKAGEDRSADIKELNKYFKKAKNLDDLLDVMSDYGYWDSESFGIIFKMLVA